MKKDALQTIGAKPAGLRGRLAGTLMNLIHGRKYESIIRRHLPDGAAAERTAAILDVGCGGGKAVKILHALRKDARIAGIDHSADMVSLSRRTNRTGISGGAVDILQADVAELPFPDGRFDVVTAFDTINFWNDPFASAAEVRRVLKDGGTFVVVNAYPQAGTKWFDFVRFKSDAAYRSFLGECGFRNISTAIEDHTIIIKAQR